MPEILMWLDAVGRAIPGWLLMITLWTGGLWLVVRGLDRVLRDRLPAAWRLPLYAAVGVRLLLPVDWASPLSPWPSAVGVASETASETTASTRTTAATTTTAVAPSATTAADPLIDAPAPTRIGARPTPTPIAHAPTSAPFPWGVMVVLAWLAGTAVLLGRLVVHRRHLRALATATTPAPSSIASAVGDRIRVRVHADAGPLAFGMRRPTIVLPRALLDADPVALRCVLAHERAHVQRHDPLLASLVASAVAVAWPVLPIWLAAARVRTLLEVAADERAVAAHQGRWREYGRVMIDLAAGVRRAPAPAVGLLGDLRERVAALRHHERVAARGPLVRAMQAGLGLLLPVALLACAGLAESPTDEPASVAARCEAQATVLAGIAIDDVERHHQALRTLADRYEDAMLDGAATPRCHDATRDALVHTATQWHDRSERDDDDELRVRASELYARFVALFPEDPDAYTLQYYGAELLWARAHHAQGEAASALYLKSSEQFAQVVDRDPDGNYRANAAYGQLLGVLNAVGELSPPEPSDADGLAPIPYGPKAQRAVEAYRRYFEVASAHGADAGRVAYGWGELAMQHNHFDEARTPLVTAVVELDADGDARAVHAAEMLLDVLTIAWSETEDPARRRRSAVELGEWLARLPTLALHQHPDAEALRRAVPTLRAGLDWEAAKADYTAGDYLRCGEAYLQIAADHPDHPRHADLLTNAITCFQAAGDTARVDEIQAQLDAP